MREIETGTGGSKDCRKTSYPIKYILSPLPLPYLPYMLYYTPTYSLKDCSLRVMKDSIY